MAIDPRDIKAIENQVKVSRGPLNLGVQSVPGDKNPPSIDHLSTNPNVQEAQPVNVQVALQSIMRMGDMGLKLAFNFIPPINYKGFSEEELRILSESGQTVPELAALAQNESTGKYMFYITLAGMLASKFEYSEEYKKKKEEKKKKSKMSQDDIALLKQVANSNLSDEEIAEKLVKK